jgi:hypothetical protein
MRTAFLTIGKLEASGAGYPLRLERTDAAGAHELLGEAVVAPDLGLPKVDPAWTVTSLPNLLLQVRGASTVFPDAGRALYDALLPTPIEAAWKQERDRDPSPMRTLLVIQDTDLAALPWELAYDGDDYRPFLEAAAPWARWQALEPLPPFSENWPLRVLIVVGARDDDAVIQAEEEVAAIWKALRATPQRWWIDLDLLERPKDYGALRDALLERRPHVLHFIGHGHPPIGDDDAFLFIESDPPWPWRSSTIGETLKQVPLRFAFLNACRSADEIGPTRSIGAAFLKAKVPAVLGMQADVPGAVAAAYASGVYSALADEQPLDAAVAAGRAAVIKLDPFWDQRPDWGMASLVLQEAPEKILPSACPLTKQLRSELLTTREFENLVGFVGRRDKRHSMTTVLLSRPDANPPPSLLLVRGGVQVGKTELALWCLEACRLRGFALRYVDLKSTTTIDYLELLRRIRDGSRWLDPTRMPASVLRERLDPEVFDGFNHLLNSAVEGNPPSPFTPGPARVKDNRKVPPAPLDEETILALFDAFRSALQRAAAATPLLLALDHLSIEGSSFREWVFPNLIRPIADNEVPGVRLLITMTDEEYKQRYEMGELLRQALIPPQDVEVGIGLFKEEEWVALSSEYCRHYGLMPLAKPIIRSVPVAKEWPPGKLRCLRSLLE